MFLLVLCLCGVAASFCLTWVAVAVIGLAVVPLYAGAMVWSGAPALTALGHALAGYAALQAGYVLAGFASGLFVQGGAGGTGPGMGASSEAAAPSPRGTASWLPSFALRSPPCRADGGPWDGVSDPGYRVRMLVLTWRGRGLSLALGRPRPHRAAGPAGEAGSPAPESEGAIRPAPSPLGRVRDTGIEGGG